MEYEIYFHYPQLTDDEILNVFHECISRKVSAELFECMFSKYKNPWFVCLRYVERIEYRKCFSNIHVICTFHYNHMRIDHIDFNELNFAKLFRMRVGHHFDTKLFIYELYFQDMCKNFSPQNIFGV